MRFLALVAGIVLMAGSVQAQTVDLVCSVPTAQVNRAVELCAELQQQLRIRSTEWDNDVCATQFLRIGLKAGEKASTTRASRLMVSQAVNTALDAFNTNWPVLVRAICGDGTLDTEFSEQCDDGNLVDLDGCDSSCQTE